MTKTYKTRTYEINVPSGNYSITLGPDTCAYDAYEYFLDHVLDHDDIIDQQNIENFDVWVVIKTTNNC